MRVLILTLAVVCLSVAACQSQAVAATITPPPSPSVSDVATTVEFVSEGLTVSLPKPAGWKSFRTDYGVVIAEKLGSVAEAGALQGLMVYVFVMPMSEFNAPTPDASVNHAQHILTLIAHDKSYIGTAHATDPIGFDWDGHAAAYYLQTEAGARHHTIVIGVSVPDKNVMVIGSLSAPSEKIPQMHATLREFFGALTVNDVGMSRTALDALPDPLPFP